MQTRAKESRSLPAKRLTILVLFLVAALGVGAVTQQKKNAEVIENQIKKSCFHYYVGMIFGQADEYMKGVKPPLTVIRDGVVTKKDERDLKSMLFSMGERMKNAAIADTEKAVMLKNMLTTFEQADVQYVGADTAMLTFLIKHDAKANSDSLCTLIVHREDAANGLWKVISEITDSKPVPPEYVK